MKKYFLLLSTLIFVFSCSQKKKPITEDKFGKYQPPSNQKEQVEIIEEKELKPFTIKKVFNLKPNMKIRINENHVDGYWGICDIDIVINSDDVVKNLYIKDSDPIDTFFVVDMNNDNIQELFLELRSPGSGSFAELLGITSDSLNNVKQIDFNNLTDDANSDGQYSAHDFYYFEGNLLVHEYPLYNDGDANCCPSGGRKKNFMNYFKMKGNILLKIYIQK